MKISLKNPRYLQTRIRVTATHRRIVAPTMLPPDPVRSIVVYAGSLTAWNAKILRLTLHIRNHCPELSPFLDEMETNYPGEAETAISRRSLATYFDLMEAMLKGYQAANPSTVASD